jgi:hypothetical protein
MRWRARRESYYIRRSSPGAWARGLSGCAAAAYRGGELDVCIWRPLDREGSRRTCTTPAPLPHLSQLATSFGELTALALFMSTVTLRSESLRSE